MDGLLLEILFLIAFKNTVVLPDRNRSCILNFCLIDAGHKDFKMGFYVGLEGSDLFGRGLFD